MKESTYDHNGYTIKRDPVPLEVEGGETTVWEFTVHKNGDPIPIIVTAFDRKKGLRETRKRVDHFLHVSAEAVRVGDPQLSTQSN